MAPELLLHKKGAGLKAKKSMDMWSLGILIFQVFQSAAGLNFWTALEIDSSDESIKSAIAGGSVTQSSIDSLIDKKFSGSKNSTIRHFLPKLLQIDPAARFTIHDLQQTSLLHGGASVSATKLYDGQKVIMKKLEGISEQVTAGFASLAQHLDTQLLSIRGTVLLGNTTILTEVEGYLHLLQHKLASHQKIASSGNVESLRKEMERWREEQVAKLHTADPALKSYLETLMTELQQLFLAQRDHIEVNGEFMKMLLEKVESIRGDVSSIRDDVSSLMKAFASFGNELRHQLKNSSNSDLLAKLREIEQSVSIVSKEQEVEKKLLKEAIAETNSRLSKLGVRNAEIEATLHDQTAKLDMLIQNTHNVPTLMVLIPKVVKVLGKLTFFQDKVRLVFFCSITLERVPCGHDGNGYEVDILKPWVKKAVPVLKVGLVLLQLGLLTSGVPIPVVGLGKNAAVDNANKNQFLTCAAGILGQQGTVLESADDNMKSNLTRAAVRNLHSNTRSAYEAISSFLREADPNLQYVGLDKHVSKSGKVAWLKRNDASVLKQFMDGEVPWQLKGKIGVATELDWTTSKPTDSSSSQEKRDFPLPDSPTETSLHAMHKFEARETISPEAPSWVTCLAFTSLHKTQDSVTSVNKLLVRSNKDGDNSVMVAASYILASTEAHINMRDRLSRSSELMTSLWVEVCPGFEQMVAIHFNINQVDLFDELLLVTSELDLYSCADIIQIMEEADISSNSESHLDREIFLQNDLPAKLSIIDTPINTQHDYLKDKTINQDAFGVEYIHGTHVAGIAIQMNPKIHLYSIPAVNITVLIDLKDRTRDGIEMFYGDRGRELSGIGKLSAALKDFLNSDSKVVNISAGIGVADERVIAFITPLMKSLREKGRIITVAAGNNSSDVDEDSGSNLLMHFVNKDIYEEVDGVRRSFRLDNIVAVAACDQNGQLASFSNYGRHKVLLAASGVHIQSCTKEPNLFGRMSGTSQAAPQVAATLAMMMELFPTWTYTQIIDRLMHSIDPISDLTAVTNSGGKLNTCRALSSSHAI